MQLNNAVLISNNLNNMCITDFAKTLLANKVLNATITINNSLTLKSIARLSAIDSNLVCSITTQFSVPERTYIKSIKVNFSNSNNEIILASITDVNESVNSNVQLAEINLKLLDLEATHSDCVLESRFVDLGIKPNNTTKVALVTEDATIDNITFDEVEFI